MKKQVLFIMAAILACGTFAQQRHRFASGEPYDIFLSVKAAGGLAQGDFNKNYTYLYGGGLAFEIQMEETRLGFGLELAYNYCVPQSFKRNYLQTKYNWAAHQVPVFLTANYYFYNEVFKPFVGIAVGTVWGKYDYSLSTEASTEEYYLRNFEGQSGWRFAFAPKVGILISTNHKHAFGFELSMPYCFKAWRLENQYSFNAALTYTFIID